MEELDRAAAACATTLVFPPNFLHHAEASSFVNEARRRGIGSTVRIRPSQLMVSSELLAELDWRGAKFEVIVSHALPIEIGSMPLSFSVVMIPSRLVDPSILLDSLPLSWRRSVSVLAPLPSVFADALSPDELFLFMSRHKLAAAVDDSRSVLGTLPGSAPTVIRDASSESTRVSLAFAWDGRAPLPLEEIASQSLEPQFYEVVVACDRVSDEAFDGLLEWHRRHPQIGLQILKLADVWGAPAFRLAEAFDLAATRARGGAVVFVMPGAAVARTLLGDALALDGIERITPDILFMTLKQYFAIGGFSRAASSFAFDLAQWKSTRVAPPSLPSKISAERIRDAREFYYLTLDPQVYQALYSVLGEGRWFRRAISFVARLRPARGVAGLGALIRSRVRAAQVQAFGARVLRGGQA